MVSSYGRLMGLMNTPVDLAGKSVLITGAARRVGAAVARTFHGHGANLIVHYRSSSTQASALCAALNQARPASAVAVQADLARVETLPALIEQAIAAFGRLDVLMNNASSFYPTDIGTITEEQWNDLFSSNLKAPLFLSQAAVPHLRRSRGLIVNMVDIHAIRPLKRHTVYCIAKAGLAMLTRSLARELGPEIRVNGIAPGPILWPEGNTDEELQQEIIDRTALKRMGSPEDIART